ncbi:TAP-like protein-domain-containing protein [Auriculariales sp. MPI-PUGE-AT-0066]|nr:TAP-like protein-domain-containing protein [Auriculariales sp. MPI-PUGE-AT-0066]
MGTGNLSVPVERVVFRQQLRAWDARLRLAGELCAKNGGSVMRYMDTGTVARDLEQLSSVISGPNTPINYWGFSGGSIIGSYWVNMFPHRVGRVILDGNGNPEEWAHSQFSEWTSNSMVDSMKAFRNFAKACAEAGAQRCALARKESTPESIEADIDSLIAHLEVRPLPVLNTSFPDIVTSQHIKLLLWQAAFAPATWPNVATLLAAAISGDGSGIITSLSSVELDTTVPASARFVFDQVMCMDAPALSPHEASVAVDKLEEAVYFASWRMKACHAWQVRGKYRFDGPFNHTLRNPILVIGNTPVTPLRNAMRVHELLGNSSRLLIQDSTGHCSISTVSLCTTNAIRGYLLDGNLPQNGLLCSPSETPFPALDRQEMEDFTSDDMRFLQVAKNLRHTWEHNPLYL